MDVVPVGVDEREDAVLGRCVDGRHARGEAEFTDERAVHAPGRRVGQRLGRSFDRLSGEAGYLEDGERTAAVTVRVRPSIAPVSARRTAAARSRWCATE